MVTTDGADSRLGLTVLVVDNFVLTLLDATVGLANVIDVGFLRKFGACFRLQRGGLLQR